MSENQSSLRFSLEESVWFKKGQEVEELLSISLDPHITIHEQDQYIVIQGKLHLSGEYKNSVEVGEEEELLWQRKYVQTLVYREEEGVYQFEHQFPVDITIPKERVENVSLLDVSVDSFDYDLLDSGNLKLNADLTISGLRNEDEISAERKEEESLSYYNAEEDYEQEDAEDEGSEEESANGVSLNKRDQEEEELVPIYNLSRNDSDDFHEELEEEEEFYQPFNVEVRKILPNEDKEENQVPASAFDNGQKDAKNQDPYNIHQLSKAAFEDSRTTDRKKKKVADEQEESSSFTEIDMVNHDESPEHQVYQHQDYQHEDDHYDDDHDKVEEVEATKKKKKKGKYESISLTDFFARKQEEKAAKLRMCIVQSGETLDYLAEKYDITVQQILRMNQLESNQNVIEGQVLYIPSYAGKK